MALMNMYINTYIASYLSLIFLIRQALMSFVFAAGRSVSSLSVTQFSSPQYQAQIK